MAISSFQRVYVERFCERCGKVEFEGQVFGKPVEHHLRAQTDTREILCDDCSGFNNFNPMNIGKLGSWFDQPLVVDEADVDG